MCVIFLATLERPTDDMVTRAWDQNKDGGGVAWREKNNRGEVEVHWQKGITDVKEMAELCRSLPLPYVAHFRIASVGGVLPELTHPFLIDANATLALRGRTRGSVLFHNGHWGDWNSKALDACIAANKRVPPGPWSDTRAMAMMTHMFSPNFMKLLPTQKGVIFKAADMEIFTGSGWDKINNVWCSNDHFVARNRTAYSHRLCRSTMCHEKVYNGDDYCYKCKQKQAVDTISTTDLEDHTQSQIKALPPAKLQDSTIYTLIEVESLYRADKLSKSKIKEFRKAYSNLGKGGNRGVRALNRIEYLSKLVKEERNSVGLNSLGSIH